jgi:HlyD family secretion protein
LRRVREGQTAIISSEALPVKLQGVVERIGTEISQSKVLPPNPAADIDRRTGKVIIRLNDIRTAKNFIHLQVDVLIQQ